MRKRTPNFPTQKSEGVKPIYSVIKSKLLCLEIINKNVHLDPQHIFDCAISKKKLLNEG